MKFIFTGLATLLLIAITGLGTLIWLSSKEGEDRCEKTLIASLNHPKSYERVSINEDNRESDGIEGYRIDFVEAVNSRSKKKTESYMQLHSR